MQQRIVDTSPASLPRQARRAMERDGVTHYPTVEVIHLRHRDRPRGEPTGEGTEWNVQWLVSGHWRNQWYPASKQHQLVWIAPYLKGPEDKPLKPPSQKIGLVER